jgi:hypothetical protein
VGDVFDRRARHLESTRDMEEAPPPTNHILRPHHIDLLAIFLLLFKEFEAKLPSPFTLHAYRVLLNEVSEARFWTLQMKQDDSAIGE